MASITTRSGKGSPLTNAEVDSNFTNLNTELGQKEVAANKGVANGYASLDAGGKVPSAQLPSYVDDVIEAANLAAFPVTGETGKIYVALDTNKTYRWSGSAYVEISASPGSTDAVPEGSTNLYFTQARARQSISVSGSLSYNSTTGVLSYTQPTNVSVFTNDAGYITSAGTAANVSGIVAIANGGTGASTAPNARTNLGLAIGSNVQAWDADLDAIAALAGTSGFLKKTAANTWSLDTATYLTGNQTITVSGDATGSGATSIALTLANSGVTAGTYTKITVDAKGRATVGTTLAASDIPELTLLKLPTAALKEAVRAATTASITLSGAQTIDGVSVVAGNRVLVKDQATASENGIYVVAAGAWTRATDMDASIEVAGAFVNVDEGTVNGGFRFDTDFKSTDTVGTTAMPWYRIVDFNDATSANTASKIVQRDASGNFSAGTITAALSGNATTATTWATGRTIALTGDVTGTSGTFNGSANLSFATTLANSGVTAGTYRSVTVDVKGRVTAGTNPTTLAGYGITDALASTATSFAGDSGTKDDITTRTDSGFWQTNTGTLAEGWPTDSAGWHHMLSVTHNNDANYYAMQIAARFDTQNWYFRNTNGSGTTAWSTMLHSNNFNTYAPTLTGTGASGTWGITITGSAATLTTGRTIGMTGDVTWTSGSFNGSANVTGTATLANSGVTAGTYTKVTVDAKGRVTTGASLASGDLPTYTGTLTSTQVTNALGFTPYNATNPSGYVSIDDAIAMAIALG